MVISQSRRARATRRRAGRMARADNDLTASEWIAIRDAWGCCAYCGDLQKALQKDCVQPLSRGGRYTLTNVVPACGSCNASKSNDEVTSWLRRTKRDERAFLLRFSEVAALLSTLDAAPTVAEVEPPT